MSLSGCFARFLLLPHLVASNPAPLKQTRVPSQPRAQEAGRSAAAFSAPRRPVGALLSSEVEVLAARGPSAAGPVVVPGVAV